MIHAEEKVEEEKEAQKVLQKLEECSYGLTAVINDTMADIMEGRK